MSPPITLRKIALIGSFRELNYPRVKACIELFVRASLQVVSPAGTPIVRGGEFVRFATDSANLSDAEIQTVTLGRIFSADVVYVVTGSNGYVGRTTCYEIGRVVQRCQPIYFSEVPDDLPVHIPLEHVATPEAFVLRFVTRREPTGWLFGSGVGELFDAERRLAGWGPPPAGKDRF
jgi:hypothetical protein